MKIAFQTNRFVSYFKLQCHLYNRTLITFFGGFILGLLVFAFLRFDGSTAIGQQKSVDMISSIFVMISMSGGIIFLDNARTQQQRLDMIMLPVGTLEKFLARYAYLTLSFLLLSVVCLILADLIFYGAFMLISGDKIHIGIGLVFNRIAAFFNGPDGGIDFISALIYYNSFCLLGGLLFRSHPLLMTIVSGVAILGILAGVVHTTGHDQYIGFLDQPVVAALSWILLLALIALNYWLSYRIFRRLQVINPRFINW